MTIQYVIRARYINAIAIMDYEEMVSEVSDDERSGGFSTTTQSVL